MYIDIDAIRKQTNHIYGAQLLDIIHYYNYTAGGTLCEEHAFHKDI